MKHHSDYINNLLNTEKYLERFKIMPPTGTLFEPEWYLAKKGFCPLCGNKLRKMLKGGFICKSNKHGKPFVYKKEVESRV